MNELLSRFRLLPLLVLVASLAFAVRVGETYTGVKTLAASAIAEEAVAEKAKPEEAAADKKTDDKKADDKKAEDAKPAEGGQAKEEASAKPKVTVPDGALPEVWADPAKENMADSPEQMQLMEDLGKRREQLNAREKALDTREAMMAAAEKQIDDKLQELSELKKQIEQLLGQQDVEENNRIASLVKIYEGMKPKDAANIFNQMEMGVLLKVVSKMSERKVAPIIAAMDTTKANDLTVQLTEMKKLPEQQTSRQGQGQGDGPTPTEAPEGSAALPGLDALGQP
ncbi:MAG: flagellar protein FlbB [Alphaproteobacteria bacterium]|nr:flagellar protein FlbB [Alphaproteobacteria bacterium]